MNEIQTDFAATAAGDQGFPCGAFELARAAFTVTREVYVSARDLLVGINDHLVHAAADMVDRLERQALEAEAVDLQDLGAQAAVLLSHAERLTAPDDEQPFVRRFSGFSPPLRTGLRRIPGLICSRCPAGDGPHIFRCSVRPRPRRTVGSDLRFQSRSHGLDKSACGLAPPAFERTRRALLNFVAGIDVKEGDQRTFVCLALFLNPLAVAATV